MNLQAVDGGSRKSDKLQKLMRFCTAIGKCHHTDDLWKHAVRVIPRLIDVHGAAVLLLNRSKNKFDITAVCFDDTEAGRLFETIRFETDTDMAGRVCTTGRAQIANDYGRNQLACKPAEPDFLQLIQNRADVPLIAQDRPIGVLTACNTKRGPFSEEDIEWMEVVARVTALASEKIRIQNALVLSCQRMKDFNNAKNRVIDHISHALKTPIAVLIASTKIIEKYLLLLPDKNWRKVYHRIQRNLERLLRMEYEVEDILREKGDSKTDRNDGTASSRVPCDRAMTATDLIADSVDTTQSGHATAGKN